MRVQSNTPFPAFHSLPSIPSEMTRHFFAPAFGAPGYAGSLLAPECHLHSNFARRGNSTQSVYTANVIPIGNSLNDKNAATIASVRPDLHPANSASPASHAVTPAATDKII